MDDKAVSQSRTYITLCKGHDGKYFFEKFKLPDLYANNAGTATWYFMTHLNLESVVVGSLTFEDYQNVREYEVDNSLVITRQRSFEEHLNESYEEEAKKFRD